MRTDHKPDGCSATECTLREAVIAANNAGRRHDRPAEPQALRADAREHGRGPAANGDLDITSGPLTIVHRGGGAATIDANKTDRVFDIGKAATTLETLTLVGGYSNKTDGDGDGGAILVGKGYAHRSALPDHHNRAPWVGGNGGGIDSDSSGLVKVIDSDVSNNDSGGSGGGVEASPNGRMLIQRSIVTSNKAAQAGGVMVFGPPVRIVDSTIAANLASAGPGGRGRRRRHPRRRQGAPGADQLDRRGQRRLHQRRRHLQRRRQSGVDQLLDDRAQPRRRGRHVRRHHRRHPPAHRGRAGGRRTRASPTRSSRSTPRPVESRPTAAASASSGPGST